MEILCVKYLIIPVQTTIDYIWLFPNNNPTVVQKVAFKSKTERASELTAVSGITTANTTSEASVMTILDSNAQKKGSLV